MAKKFGPLSDNFAGKRIILIDDSIVRGTTIGQIVKLLKDAGAKEVGLHDTRIGQRREPHESMSFGLALIFDVVPGSYPNCVSSVALPVLHGHQHSNI